MQITTVKIQSSGYLVDGTMSVPNDPRNTAFIAVEDWKLGKTHDWLLLEDTFNTETAIHDNWLKIQSYEADKAQYDIDMAAYENWVWSAGVPVQPDLPTAVPKPIGYYTQTEVDDSVAAHTAWQVGYDAWNVDTDPLKPVTYWVPEPEVYQIPANVTEPTITASPTLVPNTPDPEFTLTEIKDNKKTELKKDCHTDIESGFTSSALGTAYNYESSLKDQLNISGAAQANTTVDFTVIDGVGNKLRVSHDATQMNQVFVDGVSEMQSKKNSLYILLSSVDAAVDEAAVNAIVWV